MFRFGTNPYGENLFRIVFSNSRTFIVAGEWNSHPDIPMERWGRTCAAEEPLYPQYPGLWILERWLPPDISRERWDFERSECGPYPERGDYYLSHAFETCGPADANLDKLISWIEEGRKRSWQDVKDGCQATYDADRKAAQSEGYDRIHNALSAHLDFPMSGRYASRGSKTAGMNLSARQSGMPYQFQHATEAAPGLAVKFGANRKQVA
jgi:hypothetical protein